jgi:hypothetical protein
LLNSHELAVKPDELHQPSNDSDLSDAILESAASQIHAASDAVNSQTSFGNFG